MIILYYCSYHIQYYSCKIILKSILLSIWMAQKIFCFIWNSKVTFSPHLPFYIKALHSRYNETRPALAKKKGNYRKLTRRSTPLSAEFLKDFNIRILCFIQKNANQSEHYLTTKTTLSSKFDTAEGLLHTGAMNNNTAGTGRGEVHPPSRLVKVHNAGKREKFRRRKIFSQLLWSCSWWKRWGRGCCNILV